MTYKIRLNGKYGSVIGNYALVDRVDYLIHGQFKWYALKSRATFYAVRKSSTKGGKKMKDLRMHRLIMKTPKGLETDHINHNGLDNRRKNLRIVTHRENQMNHRGILRNNTSGFQGVDFVKSRQLWRARAKILGKEHELGNFNTKEEAAKAYADFIKKTSPFRSELEALGEK